MFETTVDDNNDDDGDDDKEEGRVVMVAQGSIQWVAFVTARDWS